MDDLHGLLAQSEQVAIVAATGMGGIGKTRLAWEYAQQYRESYSGGVWWMDTKVEDTTDNADLQSEFVQKLLAYGSRMGFPELPDNLGGTEQQAQWCYDQWLAKQPQGKRLLVIDDLRGQSAYRQVKSLWPRDDRFRVLLTTRSRFGQPVLCLSLEVLKPSASFRLLRMLVADDQRIKHELIAAKKLCTWVGHLPLGLELVGRHLEKRPNLTIATLLERLEEKRLEAKAAREVPAEMPYEDNIEAAFELSWQPLDRAKTLASLLSVFALAPIPKTLIEMSLEEWDEEDLEDALDLELVGNSLVLDLGEGQYSLHTLIHQFLGTKLETELQTEADTLRRSATQAVTQIAKSIPYPVTLTVFEGVQPVIPHLTVMANHWTHLLPEADLTWPLEGLARISRSQSLWADTEKWYQRALKISEAQLGPEHPETGTSLNNLAGLYESTGRYGEAEPLYQRTLKISEAQLGPEHPETGTSLNNLAGLYESTGRYGEAEPLYQRALKISEAQLGPEHPETGTRLNNLAGLYRSTDRYGEAEPLFQRALKTSEAQLGPEHPETGTRLNNLAGLYRSTGRYGEAEPLYQRAIYIFVNTLGQEHPSTQTVIGNFYSFCQIVVESEQLDLLSEHPLTQHFVQEIQASES
ncbi:tetratricopeptide repeat protein [Acaryochloris marina NIES-2412]|uniref:tetratricopeptide repeat protein n=1 Tax=Acaryochloris marina TaxID=155978 RepID=UPI0040583B6B